ncbi:Asp23/Gls24 family envelope stress response protein [Nonomuraea sp. NPDC050643]|uniref:Asp23/Gls24 family envelope stress response protein n=1 Tax=Nonomuraea sp. NPDC050643 TaxID=3155660 RepID=UPI0033F5BA8F
MTTGRGRTDLRFDPAVPANPRITQPRTTPDARRIAEMVASCPGVAALTGGPFGTVATYLPGESVSGVCLRDEEIEIHVAVRYGRPIPEVAAEVREAVALLADGRRVNLTVDDVTGIEEKRKARSS